MSHHDYCRAHLKMVMEDVKKHVPTGDVKKSWAWRSTCLSDSVEFHGPGDFCWYGRSCCLWETKARGWEAYLMHLGIE